MPRIRHGTVGASGAAGGVLPAGGGAGDVLFWDGTQWVASHEARAYNGFLGDTSNLETAVQGTALPISGTLYVYRLAVRRAAASGTRTLWQIVSTAGGTLTAAQNLLACYDSTGTQLGSTSADQSAVWNSTGVKSASVGSFAVAAGQDIYVQLLAVGTTAPTCRGSNGASLNVNLTGANQRVSSNGTAQTAMPASITPANLVSANVAVWFGLT